MFLGKGQIELSTLTRFAMVFFIMALATVVLLFSNTEQKGLCQTQAELTASQIASSVNQVLTSPAEEERKVIPLVAALSVGDKDRERYTVNITNRSDAYGLVIGVYATEASCRAFQTVGYTKDTGVIFQASKKLSGGNDPHQLTERFSSSSFNLLQLTPSNPSDRTSYLVLIKCQSKSLDPVTFKPKKFLYLQNCNFAPPDTGVDPNSCLTLETSSINDPSACGFNPV